MTRSTRRHRLPHAAARSRSLGAPEAVVAEPIAFEPVPMVRRRAGGWTAERQRAFIAALQRGAGVALAARSVGLSRQSALALRSRPGGAGFAEAWDVAIAMARGDAGEILHDIAVHGHRVPLIHRGRKLGEVRRFDTRLLLRLLAASDRVADRVAAASAAASAGSGSAPALVGPDGSEALSARELSLLRTVLRKSRARRQA